MNSQNINSTKEEQLAEYGVNDHKETNQETLKSKVRYSNKDLKEFKELITEKYNQSVADYEQLKEALSFKSDNGTNDTCPTFNLGEDGADAISKEEIASQAIRLKKYIEHLHNALIRIENKTYGICSVTGTLIPKERLRSVPHTTQSINAKLGIKNK